MGFAYNALTINGVSTATLDFDCLVETNSPITMGKKKDILHEGEMVNGVLLQSIEAYEPVEKPYIFYLSNVTKDQARKFKALFDPTGWFTPYDDPNIRHYYYSFTMESEPLDDVDGYRVTVTFLCDPFEYEPEKVVTLGTSIVNHTNAPMFPKLEVLGSVATQQTLTIGAQTMIFKNGIPIRVWVENKLGAQNVTNNSGANINSQVKGPFFVIPPKKTVAVSKTSGITSVKMTTRWGWR